MLLTNAPLIVDLAYFVTLVAPVVAWKSVSLARRRDYRGHRRVQAWLLSIAVGMVVALEIQIRLAGGSGALLRASSYAGTTLLGIVATIHIAGAILTYL